MAELWTYHGARLTRESDGDSCALLVPLTPKRRMEKGGIKLWDYGFYVYHPHCLLATHPHFEDTFRLAGINAWEKDEPLGIAARDRLTELITGVPLTIQTIKRRDGGDRRGKWRRWIAEVFLPDGRSVNKIMVAEKLAVETHY